MNVDEQLVVYCREGFYVFNRAACSILSVEALAWKLLADSRDFDQTGRNARSYAAQEIKRV